MANVTLRIDDELLKKAHWLALQRKTSISGIIKPELEEFIARSLACEATLGGIEDFFAHSKA